MGAQTALALLLAAVGVIVVTNWVSERTGLPVRLCSLSLVSVTGCYRGRTSAFARRDDDLHPAAAAVQRGAGLVVGRDTPQPAQVISLSVILVLLTAAAVGSAFALLVSGATLAAGMALGAAGARTDPVAALAVARKVGLPLNIVTLIEGEGLLNDATALTMLSVAIAVGRGAGFSFPSSLRQFALAAVGGLVIGLAFAWCRRFLRRLPHDVMTANAISLATRFLAYLAAEKVHASGVLAVVVCGLVVGHDSPRSESGASRLQTRAVWRFVNFLLEGLVFLLIGQQLPAMIEGLHGRPLSTIVVAVAVTTAVVLLMRPLWLLFTQSLPRPLHTRLGNVLSANPDDDADQGQNGRRRDHNTERLSGRELLVLSWAGTRGVVSLAAIFAVPLVTDSGAPFPARDLLLFCTLVVVLVTLIGQGSTFGPVVRALGVHANAVDESDCAIERGRPRLRLPSTLSTNSTSRLATRSTSGRSISSDGSCPLGSRGMSVGSMCCRIPTSYPATPPTRPRPRYGGRQSMPNATSLCAGGTWACCPIEAFACWNANSTTKR